MSWRDLLRSALAGLGQHKLRSGLTLIGVTLGSLLLFVSLSGGLGVIRAVNDRLSAGNRLLEVIVSSGAKSEQVTEESARAAGFTQEMSAERRIRLARAAGVGAKRMVPLTIANVPSLKELQHVSDGWANLLLGATARAPNGTWGHVVVETLPPDCSIFRSLLISGQQPDNSNHDQVWVSELFLYSAGYVSDDDVKRALGQSIMICSRNRSLDNSAKPTSRLGKEQIQSLVERLAFKSRPLKIAGVFRSPTEGELRRNPNLTAALRHVMVPQSTAITLWKGLGLANARINAKLLAKRPEDVKKIEAAVAKIGYRTKSLSELAIQIRTAVLLITAVIIAIAAAAMLISALGITNTMVMNVMQRRKNIAVMKAIGARDRDISRMFLLEGTLIGVLGGALGLVLGLVLTKATGSYVSAMLETRLDTKFYGDIFAYPLWLIIGTPVVAALVTTLATIIPARSAARIDPAQTLRGL